MKALLPLAKGIDKLSTLVGKATMWLVLATTLISAGNAIVRKAFDSSSNGMLEIQWYLFAAVFMLGASYCFLTNAHVRIDFISSRLGPRTRNWIDVLGILFILFPFCYLLLKLSIPFFYSAYVGGETSENAGGLIRWPAYLLIPVGFALLALQGVSELIKRLAYLAGHIPDPIDVNAVKSDEQKHLEALEQEARARLAQEK